MGARNACFHSPSSVGCHVNGLFFGTSLEIEGGGRPSVNLAHSELMEHPEQTDSKRVQSSSIHLSGCKIYALGLPVAMLSVIGRGWGWGAEFLRSSS